MLVSSKIKVTFRTGFERKNRNNRSQDGEETRKGMG